MDRVNTDKKNIELCQPVAVLGVGVEGRSTIDYLLRQGIENITALDRKKIEGLPAGIATVFGEDHDQGLERFPTIFRSPGIRPDHPSLKLARAVGSRVTSAVSHFLAQCRAPIVGVTGTVGKGTASSLTAKMLHEAGFKVHLGGNIGSSPLDFLHQVEPDHRVVLEISSFQAMDTAASPNVSVLLKTTSEHLDWHVDLDEYWGAKANLLAQQGENDIIVYNFDSEPAAQIASLGVGRKLAYSFSSEVTQGIFFNGTRFILRENGQESTLPIDISRVRLPGRFNLENVAAAILASLSVGAATDTSCQTAEQFEGLPHRLEFVAEGGGIRFYNDSYATRPEATLGALTCFERIPLSVIMGGSEKYSDFDELAKAVVDHPTIVHISLIGDTAGRLRRSIEKAGRCSFVMAEYESLEEAMEGAQETLNEGGILLLAPACASFGLFPNYKVRGERFRAKAIEMVLARSKL